MQSDDLKIGCVLMAAGNAIRFGENKLASVFEGKTLIQRALEAIPHEEFDKVSVVTQYPLVMAQAEEMGFNPIYNEHPEYGISHTIELGIKSMEDFDAIMFMVSDQPMLKRESVRNQIEFYRQNPDKIVGMGHNGVRGNPCIFPSAFFDSLLKLEEDCGGNSVIRRNEEFLLVFEVDKEELTDVDRKEDVEKIKSEVL